MIKTIPKVIHQVWSDKYRPMPEHLSILGDTWKEHHPKWKYLLWNEKSMQDFILEHYPQYFEHWSRFPHDIQRWDSIRYLILDKIGGMYVDCDYEAVGPIDPLIEGRSCCFAREPEKQRQFFVRHYDDIFNNAMMLSTPGHPFMKKIIRTVFDDKTLENNNDNKLYCVLETTGPWVLMGLYENLSEAEKEDIYLIPAEYVTPFSLADAQKCVVDGLDKELESYLDKAHAVHYYLGEWI